MCFYVKENILIFLVFFFLVLKLGLGGVRIFKIYFYKFYIELFIVVFFSRIDEWSLVINRYWNWYLWVSRWFEGMGGGNGKYRW